MTDKIANPRPQIKGWQSIGSIVARMIGTAK
jgi:hypothetical protein